MPSLRRLPRPALLAAGALLLAGLTGCTATPPADKLPEGFPTSVPVVQPVDSGSQQTGSWQVRSTVADRDAQTAALKKLTDAGYTVIGELDTKTGKTYSLANSSYSIRLGFEHVDGTYAVTYGVSARTSH